MTLTIGQLDRLATLFLNIAQAFFVLAFAVSYFATGAEIINAIKALLLGLFFASLSLKAEKQKTEGVNFTT
jgi:hypothetical protein